MIKITDIKNTKVEGDRNEMEMLNYSGYFGKIESGGLNKVNMGMIFSCREGFHDDVLFVNKKNKNKTNQFIFAHGGTFKKLQEFIEIIENKLNLSARNKIKLFNIKPKYCLVKISDWWKLNNFRLQFLTILLRAGTNYSKSVDYALYSQRYFKDTKLAVEMFLDGYTKVRKHMDIFDDFNEDREVKDKKTGFWIENPNFFDSYEGWADRLTGLKEKDLKNIFYK